MLHVNYPSPDQKLHKHWRNVHDNNNDNDKVSVAIIMIAINNNGNK